MDRIVSLINIDSIKMPNIALKKLEIFYLDRGYKVYWNHWLPEADKTFVSCIFSWNMDKCLEYEGKAIIGGSGYNLNIELPPDIEEMKPKINYGFTTRGCIRNCPFCIVPKKEGKIRVTGEILDFWDGKSKEITLLDNNIMAIPEHFEMTCCQIAQYKLIADFNQGLDIRLLNKDNVRLLSMIKHKEYHFAFDEMKHEKYVTEGIKLLKQNNINRSAFYVLCGFNTSYHEDLYRLNYLKAENQNAFLQRYNYTKDKILSILARWANQHAQFHARTFKEFVMLPKHKNYVKLCQEAGLL